MTPQREIALGEVKRVESPVQARRWLRSILVDVAPQSIDDACLLLSELVTNAFIHGGGSPAVRASVDGEDLLLSVRDASSAGPVHRPPGTADETGGLGLTIVDRLTSAWGVDPLQGGKVVWAHMPLQRC